jgi:ribosomal protein L14
VPLAAQSDAALLPVRLDGGLRQVLLRRGTPGVAYVEGRSQRHLAVADIVLECVRLDAGALLADAALAEPRIAAIVARESGTARAADGRRFRFDNTNVLIGRVEGARGVKTGWTKAAGRCLVAYAEREGTRVLVVMLGAPDRWWDAVAMIESAFDDARARRTSRRP